MEKKKYKLLQWIVIYPDDVTEMADNLTLEEANELAEKLRKEDGRCNVRYIVE